jgi:hypothetical protein
MARLTETSSLFARLRNVTTTAREREPRPKGENGRGSGGPSYPGGWGTGRRVPREVALEASAYRDLTADTLLTAVQKIALTCHRRSGAEF